MKRQTIKVYRKIVGEKYEYICGDKQIGSIHPDFCHEGKWQGSAMSGMCSASNSGKNECIAFLEKCIKDKFECFGLDAEIIDMEI